MTRLPAASFWICLSGLALGQPVKLDVRVPSTSIASGAAASVVIELRDANNQPAAARKAMQLELKARLDSGEEKALGSTSVAAGQTTVTTTLPRLEKEGLVYVWASHPEVRSGGGYIRVKSSARAIAMKGVAAIQGKLVQPVVAPPVIAPPAGKAKILTNAKIAAIAKNPKIAIIAKDVIDAQPVTPPAPVSPPPQPVVDPSSARYQIVLGLSPQGSFLADGKDPATVHAFVFSDDPAPLPGFRLLLSDGSGRMNPKPLIIPPGADEGTATLTYNRVGDVKVEYLASTPTASVAERTLSIHFDPPITRQILSARPKHISFLDTANLELTLTDDQGNTTATDVDRQATLTLVSGQGTLAAHTITIAAGSSTALVQFTPLSWGTAEISSKIAQLGDTTATIDVDPPYQLLGLAAFGGLLGGFIFTLLNREAPKWRIPVGVLTGLMLVWAMLMFGMNVLPKTLVLNPLSLVMISTLGGWAGTQLFDPLLKKLGFGGAPPDRKD